MSVLDFLAEGKMDIRTLRAFTVKPSVWDAIEAGRFHMVTFAQQCYAAKLASRLSDNTHRLYEIVPPRIEPSAPTPTLGAIPPTPGVRPPREALACDQLSLHREGSPHWWAVQGSPGTAAVLV